MHERLSKRMLRDIVMSEEKKEIYDKLLSLEEDRERISGVNLEYGGSLGISSQSDPFFGRVYWSSRHPLNMNVEVTLTKDFSDLEELKKYLIIKGLPGERAYQFSGKSYGLDFEEHDFGVHFGLER